MRENTFNRMFPSYAGREFVCAPMIAADHLSNLIKQPLDRVGRSGELLAEGLLTAQKLYQGDFIIVFFDVAVEAEAMGVKLKYSPQRNPQIIKQVKFSRIKPTDISHRGRVNELFLAAYICRRKLGADFTIFFSLKDPFSLACLILGADEFLPLLVQNPNQALELLEICCETQIKFISNIIAESYIPLVGAPLASGSILGLNNFRRYVEEYMRRIFAEAKNRGSFSCLHLCGKISDLSSSLASLELDLLSFEEWHAPMWCAMPKTIPMGYVSTESFLWGNKEKLCEEVNRCLKEMPRPCILSSGCDIPAKADPELVKTMLKARNVTIV